MSTPLKRKTSDVSDSGRAKKESSAKKAKPPKAGPVNLDIQCGVSVEGSGRICLRSLTCKTHSLAAKRAVQGRSAPLETLMQAWGQKHQPSSEPATSSPLLKSPEKKVKKVKPPKAEPVRVYGEISDSDLASGDELLDSDDECDRVLAGLKQGFVRARPFPGLAADSSFFTVRNTRISRWRNSFAGVLSDQSKA